MSASISHASNTEEAALLRLLRPGEAIAWTGRPDAAALARSRRACSLAGLPFLAFGFAWQIALLGPEMTGAERWLASLWGLPFLVIGLALTAAAPLALLQARFMLYAVTDRRVLVLDRTPLLGGCASLDLSAVARPERREADLVFAAEEGEGGSPLSFAGLDDPGAAEAAFRRVSPPARH